MLLILSGGKRGFDRAVVVPNQYQNITYRHPSSLRMKPITHPTQPALTVLSREGPYLFSELPSAAESSPHPARA